MNDVAVINEGVAYKGEFVTRHHSANFESEARRFEHINDRYTNEQPDAGSGSVALVNTCLLYTPDAADEEDSVDLGGPHTITKNTVSTATRSR